MAVDAIGTKRTPSVTNRFAARKVVKMEMQGGAASACTCGTYIGNVSLYEIDRKHRHAGLAIFIGDEKNRGKGYGSLAVRMMLEFAFTDLKLHRIFCKTETSFHNAIKMYESLGFRREGLLREHEWYDSQYVDKVIYGILETEFEFPE